MVYALCVGIFLELYCFGSWSPAVMPSDFFWLVRRVTLRWFSGDCLPDCVAKRGVPVGTRSQPLDVVAKPRSFRTALLPRRWLDRYSVRSRRDASIPLPAIYA